MHELSIATTLVDAACEYARHARGARVETVHVRLGPLAGVVPDALIFAFGVAAAETPIAGAQLVLEQPHTVAAGRQIELVAVAVSNRTEDDPAARAPDLFERAIA